MLVTASTGISARLSRRSILPAGVPAEVAAIGADPESSLLVFVQGANKPVGDSLVGAQDFESAVAVVQQAAALGTDPKRAVAGGAEREDAVVAHGGGIGAVEEEKTGAVEAGQSPGGADPEIAVAGLGDYLYFVLRQTILHAPDASAVLAGEGGDVVLCGGDGDTSGQ
jgi:hypothetical protein